MSYASTVLGDGPIGYWRLGEALFSSAAVDQTGNLNGTYTNSSGITLGQTGIPGGGGGTVCKFTAASSGYVALGNEQSAGDTWTIECWVKVGSTGSTQYLFAGTTTGSWGINLTTNNPPLIQTVKVATTGLALSSVGVPVDSAFHHVVATKAGAANHIYLDGADVTTSVTNATTVGTSGNSIGRQASGNYMDGSLGEVAVYTTALTPTQVSNHYSLGNPTSPVVGNTSYDNSTAWTLYG